MTVEDEKCPVYCDCKQCEMGNLAYLWNAVLEHSSPRHASLCGDGEEILAAAWTPASSHHHQMDRNTDTSVDVDFHNHGEGPYYFSWLKVPTSAFTFKTLLRMYANQPFFVIVKLREVRLKL